MPMLERANTHLYYDVTGTGEALIALHGFTVNGAYWHDTGVTAALAAQYQVIALDLRGHGRSRVRGEPFGYDPETLGDDVTALADALGLDRFHLLGHSTGGMVAARYAMRHSARLLSLMLIGTDSATLFGPGDPRLRRQAMDIFASLYERNSWPQIFAHLRQIPGPLLYQLNRYPASDRLWAQLETIVSLGEPQPLAAFARSFFSDPDPRIEKLRQIGCPTLVLVGEHDKLFRPASARLAQEISQARAVILPNIGHMTALEAPALTSTALLRFLNGLSR